MSFAHRFFIENRTDVCYTIIYELMYGMLLSDYLIGGEKYGAYLFMH